MPKPRKLDPIGEGLPFEVEHWMDWLNLDPPTPPLEGLADDAWVVSVADYKLVAVFNVGIFEGNLAYWFLWHGIFFLVFVLVMRRQCIAGGIVTNPNWYSFIIQKLYMQVIILQLLKLGKDGDFVVYVTKTSLVNNHSKSWLLTSIIRVVSKVN